VTRIGLVGGTGVAGPPGAEVLLVETPFGEVEVQHARDGSLDLFFLPRHGTPARPAHRVNHKANVEALARCRVDAVVAINSVGALVEDIAPGTLVVPDDYLDFRSAPLSFHDDSAVHVDVGEAYCPDAHRLLVEAARAEGARVRDGGVYAATDGPRLETRAEVRALRALGGHVVGMTGCPEAALARERCLCYASLCVVTNHAAGVSGAAANARTIRAEATRLADLAGRVARRAAAGVRTPRPCACARALEGARL
jgi:5'-methylthioadenosine phosphorylase